MKRSKFSEEQIACALRQAEGGTAVADVCRQLGSSEASVPTGPTERWSMDFVYDALGVLLPNR
jgi:putative transposase